jgi:GT2 family glycosyltransferase
VRAIDAPVSVGEVELGAPLEARSPVPQDRSDYDRSRLLVRLHGQPLGFLELRLAGDRLDPARLADETWRRFEQPIRQHLVRDQLPVPDQLGPVGLPGLEECADLTQTTWHEPITVVVCTRDRPTHLAVCLPRLQQLRYDAFEVIVVDNAPTTQEPARTFRRMVGDDPRFRYVREPKPGLSQARNAGLAAARFAYVAFTDDDVLVDPRWLNGIARGFARDPNAGCVTGLVPSAHLDTPLHWYFDRRTMWSSRLEPHIYDLAHGANEYPFFPFRANVVGSGANFAILRDLIQQLGGFDESLGAGSPTRGGEDIDGFFRVLRTGRSIVYEPSAIVWHVHRADFAELRRQIYGYGLGFGAYATKYVLNHNTRSEVVSLLPRSLAHMARTWYSIAATPHSDAMNRRALVFAEMRGMAAGPIVYALGRWRLHRRRPSSANGV